MPLYSECLSWSNIGLSLYCSEFFKVISHENFVDIITNDLILVKVRVLNPKEHARYLSLGFLFIDYFHSFFSSADDWITFNSTCEYTNSENTFMPPYTSVWKKTEFLYILI